MVGHSPAGKRDLIHHEGGHIGGVHGHRADVQHCISRACRDGQSMLERCPTLK
jgi:hypothetical protein